MHRLPLFLLLLMLPLAVAGQNIGTGIAAAVFFVQIWRERRQLPGRWKALWAQQREPIIAGVVFVAVVSAAGHLNVANTHGASFVAGYLAWLLLPPVAFLAQGELAKKDWEQLFTCLAGVAVVMGAVAAAQAIFGFRIVGMSFVPSATRAQGFYSHPLTFAYVLLMFFPLGCSAVVRDPRSARGWCVLVGSAVAVFASQSRTVQAVAALVVLYNIMRFARGRTRWALLVAALAAGGGMLATDNPVSRKFRMTLDGGYDVRGDYPDDRIAFWRVATDMIRDRPLLGHGENLDTAYREPYYAAAGLANFERKYEAHNMFLQATVNGGLLGLMALLAWFVLQGQRGLALARSSATALGGNAFVQALVALCAAALTQNAIQDSEVRYALTLAVVGLVLVKRPRPAV